MPSERTGLTATVDQAEAEDRLTRQRAAITQAEKTLGAQRAELVRMMAELKQLQRSVRDGQAPELEVLRRDNEELRRVLAEHAQSAVVPAVPREVADELAALRAEVQRLHGLLTEKESLLEEQRRPPPALPREAGDLESYEAELNQFRLQLEGERRQLKEELEHLRARNDETAEARREMEMELSRERAELSRERTRLERLRDEARAELERFQRDAGMWDRLAPVQRLREELADRKDGTQPT